ncbi:NERD domain-containing protein [Microbulbifer sp. VAAC004]|uniref:NERD domain-containing protein n=1 Tax=unclassified Microbulbifer TaxID=2619833 RepID=UPI00403AC3F7
MARMIPQTIHPDVKSSAEKRMFRLLKDAPNTDNWIIIHSLGLSRHQTKRRGEIDFVILCDRGVFIIEVKGGRISRNGGIWQTQNKYNEYSKLHESPYEQASSAMFALERDVRAKFMGGHPLHKVIMGYGVMLPNTSESTIEFGTDGDRDLTYCIEDSRQPISHYISRIASFFEKKNTSLQRPTPKDLEVLSTFLRGDFDLLPPLWSKAKETEEELLELTKEQYQLLDTMVGRPRIIIRGAAGTGKTELARREVLNAARSRKSVLLLCYNRLLAAKLQTDPLCSQYSENIQVSSVYQYMDELIRSSPYIDEFRAKQDEEDPDLIYRELYPEYASLAKLNDENSWDMLIVDEGQDFITESVLDFLGLCLSGGLESGSWRWFMDDNNQAAVYGKADPSSISRLEQFGVSHLLTINCRNTRQIHDETSMLTTPEMLAVARVEGLPVRYVWYSKSSDQKKLLKKQINRIVSGGISRKDVVILSGSSGAKAVAGELTGSEVKDLDEACLTNKNAEDVVRRTTISAFKGLEADVIILTDINDFESDWWKSVLYVGMSRARVELVILLPEKLRVVYNQKVREMLDSIKDEV